MSTLICDYPNVVEAELFEYALKAMPDLSIDVKPEPSRFQFVDKNSYLAGVDNLQDFGDTTLIFVRRGLVDFFVRYIQRMDLNGKLNAPFWAGSFEAKLPWIFDCRPVLVQQIVGFWLDRERKQLPPNAKVLNRTNFGPTKPVELFEGLSLTPAKPKTLPSEYSQALLTIAQTL
jgi:hypothetical protein